MRRVLAGLAAAQVVVSDNVFEAGSPAFGYSDSCRGTQWSNNRLDTGQILNP